MKKNEWFEKSFLPSLEARMNNPKYPNQCIISQKQADICYKYMREQQHSGDYGCFSTLEYKTDCKFYQVTFRGRYIFLTAREILANNYEGIEEA